jgi:aspartyl-tRNA(Asn)/glutamyl-tRNA(Gln) amidotransferase subunit B
VTTQGSWEVVVGLETHAQLRTRSKMFSGASTAFGAAPNTQASPVDIALPGTLPVPNRAAVELAIRFGLVVGGADLINRSSVFARKNYFYPDLPKGYQISQYELPIVKGGELTIDSPTRGKVKVRLTRAHLEEDAGKSLHEDFRGMSGIDLNRAGTPLLEIVSEPELQSAQEAVAYARSLHKLLTEYLICDGDMEKGSFRCDANVSVKKAGTTELGTRCEIKNLNSFRFLEQAINYEVERQIAVLQAGGRVQQETRLFDPERNETRAMRTKEDAQDYRYFPDPDLLPLMITDADIERVRASIPESLDAKRDRFLQYGIPPSAAQSLTTSLSIKTKLFEETLSIITQYNLPPNKQAEVLTSTANTVVSSSSVALGDWGQALVRKDVQLPRELALLQKRTAEGDITSRQAKEVYEAVLGFEGTTDEIIEKRGMSQISDASEIEKIVDQVLAANAKQVQDYRAGKQKAFNSLVGQVMKATRGKANPAQVNELLKRKLG